jgi:hypothetical protein
MIPLDHDTASRLLVERLDGPVASELETPLRLHVIGCWECRAWLEALHLLTCAATGTTPRQDEHLSADEVARFALNPGALDAVARVRGVRHLLSCRDCAADLDLASEGGHDEPQTPEAPLTAWAAGSPIRGFAIRSGVAAAVIAGIALALSLVLPRGDHPLEPMPAQRLTGVQTIRADSVLTVEHAAVEPGASLRLEGGQAVVLGDGFSIKNGASLGVYLKTGDSRERPHA